MSKSDKPTSRRSAPKLTPEDYEFLGAVSLRADVDPRLARRARFLLAFAHGMKITDAAKLAGFSRPVAYRWLERVAELGVKAGIADKPYEKGNRPDESLRWLTAIAKKTPAEFDEKGTAWSYEQLTRFVRSRANREGHPDLARITTGGLRRILNAEGVDFSDSAEA